MAGKVSSFLKKKNVRYFDSTSIVSSQNSEAIDMCLKHNVTLTEALADQLTSGVDNNRILVQLAEVAQRQGDYQLAAKKFTQAGDRVTNE